MTSGARLNSLNTYDRLPAFAGIVQFWAAFRNDQPLLGLWRNTLAHDLGWAQDDKRKFRPQMNPPGHGFRPEQQKSGDPTALDNNLVCCYC